MTAALLVLLVWGSGGVAAAADAAAPPQPPAAATKPALLVRYGGGLLSVRANGVPLGEVLDAIEAEAGVRFVGEAFDQREVWKEFDDVTLAEALRRVIGRQNFVLTYGEDGAPLRVTLLGVPRHPRVRAAATAIPSFSVAWRREPPVPVSVRVAGALGSGRTISPAQLVRALRVADPGVRQDAVDAFLLALRRSPSLRAAFLALSEERLAGLVRVWAGRYAGEILRVIAARTRRPEVRGLATRAIAHVPS